MVAYAMLIILKIRLFGSCHKVASATLRIVVGTFWFDVRGISHTPPTAEHRALLRISTKINPLPVSSGFSRPSPNR
jgi:hypothetical protein